MKHLFIAAALALVSLPSFADNGKPFAFGEPAEAAKATRTIEVVLKDIAFEPKSIKVKAGETVRFVLVNEGKLPHEFNLGDKAMHAEHQKEMIAMQGKMFTAGMNHEGMDHGQMDHGQMGAGRRCGKPYRCPAGQGPGPPRGSQGQRSGA
ncbi:MAG: cupredoxin domain-containing protein, partial [Pseudomonas sp.]|nr:cupredoxin domain-containing protein [Pseudomonas sp.]